MKVGSFLFSFVFGSMFTGVGIFILLQTSVPMLQSWHLMQAWQASNAELIDVQGAENNTKATYRYRVGIQDFQNNRVYVAEFKDNIGSYHQKLFDRLAHLKNQRIPVQIWYDPSDPKSSIIDRSMRWGFWALITGFCSVFVVIGFASWGYGINSIRKDGSGQRLRSKPEVDGTTPILDNPWLKNKHWQSERIRSNAKTGMLGMWVFAVFWNAISLPALFVLKDQIKSENYAVLIVLLFPLIGVYLIFLALRKTREWRRFGIVELIMDPFPGAIGGQVGGGLSLKQTDYQNTRFRVGLECVYSYVSGSGKNRSRREKIHWAEAGDAKIHLAGDGIRLDFFFDVPNELPEADVEQTGDYQFWRLKLIGDVPGVDLDREYNIPVFKTGQRSRFAQHSISKQVLAVREEKAVQSQAAIHRGDWDSTALAKVVRIKHKGDSLQFYFPMFRKKLLTLIALIFGLSFGFATYTMNQSFGEGALGIVILIFSIPFGLVGLIGSLAAIYLMFNNLSVVIGNRQIDVKRRLFVFPIGRTILSAEQAGSMEIKSTGSTGQGVNKVNHYKVLLATADNKKNVTVAEDIDGEDLAEQFKDFLYQRLTA